MRTYADGTFLVERPGFSGGVSRGRALCSDGQVRSVRFPRGGHPDTFFSIPAVTQVRGLTITGFVIVETREGFSTATDDDPAVVKFISYKYGKNGSLLP